MSDDETVRVTHIVPEHVRDAAKGKTEHGELSEHVRNVYRRIAFGEDVAEHETVRMELERVRDEKDDIRRKIREFQSDLEAIERKEARLEEKLSQHTSRQDKYEGHLESLETQLAQGAHISTTHPGVERAANVADVEKDEVIEELQERNPSVPDHAFVDAMNTDRRWNGFNHEEDDR